MAEKIRITANRLFLRSVLSEVIAIRKLIENRDIGDVIATSLHEAVKAQPHSIRLEVFWYSVKEPPFRRSSQRITQATCKIPDVKRSSLSWDVIKEACGGVNGYMWGRYLATANLSNGRQMQVYGNSENEAEQRLKALQELSDTTILTLSVSEQKKEGKRAPGQPLYKDSVRVYPAYFAVVNTKKIQVETQRELSELPKDGTVVKALNGNFKRKRTQKIPLWVNTEPSTAKSLIQEALRVRGSETT